jgi:hypothetical protein
MSPPDIRWADETERFVQQFAKRAATWDERPGDLEDVAVEPWIDPDNPDPVLDAAHRGDIVPHAGGGNARRRSRRLSMRRRATR